MFCFVLFICVIPLETHLLRSASRDTIERCGVTLKAKQVECVGNIQTHNTSL
jgi:hypothetical protein